MTHTWRDIPGSLILLIDFDEDQRSWYADGFMLDDRTILDGLKAAGLKELEVNELEIEFVSSGYSDPGKISGPPDRCYPPESEDERELKYVYLNGVRLTDPALCKAIWNHWFEDVQKVKIDTDTTED
jgi:hypothetical protein